MFISAQSARLIIPIIAGFFMQIDRQNSRGRFSAAGRLLPEEASELAVSALAAASAERVSTLILDLQSVTLTRGMSVTECHNAGERLARAGRGLEKVAFVTREDCVEPHAFIFTVARNRGLRVATFESEPEALQWLQAA